MTTPAQHNYNLLVQKLDQFIRKYYINALIRGSLYFVAAALSVYLLISALEYFFFFSSGVRTTLLFGYIAGATAGLTYWVGRPLFAYFRLGPVISHDQAAIIIGKHFPNVEDKLLNVLQLRQLASQSEETSLIEASINQKIGQLEPVPFVKAINLNYNRKYAKYALVPLAVLLVLLLGAPSVLQDSNERLINSNRSYEKPAPFQFDVVDAHDLSVMQYQDLPLTIRVTGEALPNEVLLRTDDYQYRLEKQDANTFTYTFRKVQSSFSFDLLANGYSSQDYQVKVLPKPLIVNFTVKLDYPDYTGKKDETKENIGDLVVPAGTRVSWSFQGKNTSSIEVSLGDSTLNAQRQGEEQFQLAHTFISPTAYKLYTSNAFVNRADSIGYFVSVVPDEFPQITVDEFVDSLNPEYRFVAGQAEDDYGLTQIAFRYRLERAEASASAPGFKTVPIRTNLRSSNEQFTFPLDLQEFNLNPGDAFSYYFITWDNDAINGRKSAKTPLMRYAMPTEEEFRELAQSSSNNLKEEMEKTLSEVQSMKKDIQQLQDELIQKKDANWSDKQKLEQMMNKQQQLNDKLQDLQKEMANNLKQQQQFQKDAERIQDKQEQLQEMMDELLTEEMKEMMAKLEELMEKLNKEEMLQELGDFEMSNEQLEKELDRMMELFKQLEFEARMQDAQQQLEELAEKQEELAEQTEQKDGQQEGDEQKEGEQNDADQSNEGGEQKDNPTQEELAKQQEKLNEEFDKLKDELSELDKMEQDLGDKMDFSDLQEQQEQTKQDMQESLDKLEQNQNQQAGQKQRKASQQMQQMAQQMNSMMQSSQMQQMTIDMEATRQILDNLIKLSFDQEELMANLQEVNPNTPKFKTLIQEQFKIKEDVKMVEDSLLALSKRVVQISSFVNKEVTEVKYNMESAIELLADRKKSEGTAKQQYVMTGLNNLALMLDEILNSMQEQMSSMMAGQQMCQKPQSGQSMQQLQQMQQQLNQQMTKMMEQMNQQQGEGKPGKPGQQGQGKEGRRKMSKELAEMAAKQAAIRQAMQELDQQMNKDGQNTMGDLGKIADQMEQTEEDLVNRRLTTEMLKRQQEITVRMLEAAEAEKQREQSPQREAEQGSEITRQMPPSLEEYLKKREAEVELYKTVPPSLKAFYKNIVEEYFKSIDIND